VNLVDAPGKDVFAGLVDSTFRLHTDGGELDIRLVEVEEGRESPAYEQFSLIFRAPPDAPAEQASYRVEHDATGAFELFLVPVAGDTSGIEYQAVFNRRVDGHGGEAG
jgi:hypothetical protein